MTYLIFAEEGKVEDDLQGFGVGGKDNKVSKATVQGLRGLVGALLQLYHVTKEAELASEILAQPPSCHQ